MDGYSVKDAAIVLGIPERRVWELLARGVLAGAPEGPDGMIVYLQPRSAPSSVTASAGPSAAAGEGAAPKANGNGGSAEFSPFRELLTEFRNLTERYGQALLALGEARGEVASLRNRVDLLEARMDLRLPSSQPTSTVAWEIPEFAAPEADAATAPTASFEADAFMAEEEVADKVAADELDGAVAGEDEPAAEPMIDLVDEVVLAEVLEAAVLDADELQAADEPPLQARVDEVAAQESVTAEPEPLPHVAAEHEAESAQMAAAAAIEESAQEPEAPKRRARGSRTATAAFAAALARADDPTIAELPGAEETAAALAALQRDIDASRVEEEPEAAEAVAEVEPPIAEEVADDEAAPAAAVAEHETSAAEQDVAAEEQEPEVASHEMTEPIAAAAIIAEEAIAPEGEEPEAMATGTQEETTAPEAAAPEAAAPEPEQPSVPSYYSTDVVEPDWFADGDFSWLEAAQAEGMRIEGGQPPQAAEPQAGADNESPVDLVHGGDQPEVQAHDVAQDTAAPDAEDAGVAAELAFGEHPATEATQPDVGHEGFEPSVESQALAEEEARTAIQDAFEEAPPDYDASTPAPAAAVAVAAAEPEPAAESTAVVEEPETNPQAMDEPQAEAELDAPAEESPVEAAAYDEHGDHEAEVEAEAIQDAFEETNPAPTWSPPMAAAEPAYDEPAEAPSEEPRAVDESHPAAGAAAYRGPEEFIAPATAAAAPAPMTSAPEPQPKAASDEEELMWLGEEFEESDLEVAAEGWRSPTAPPAPTGPSPVLELTDTELAQLAEDEGWDREEVEAIRRLLGRPTDAPDLDTTAHMLTQEPDTAPPVSPAPAGDALPPWSSQGASGQPGPASDEVEDPEWLQRRSGAAADAYRRLRKLFPS